MTIRAVDLFCGWGGFTLGAESAGTDVVWACDYWPLAVEVHERNHPEGVHVCEDLLETDWSTLPDFDLLLASPPCQGHSTGSQPRRRPRHSKLRESAWVVVQAAEALSPRAIVVENVPAFSRWDGYPMWRFSLEMAGYEVVDLYLLASNHGVPQRRLRLFVVAWRGSTAPDLRGLLDVADPEPAFGPCVEWDSGEWRPITAAGAGARKRIAAGIVRHGPRFLTQHVTNHPGVPLSESIRTITTQDQWAVVDGSQYRPFTSRETARGMGFPDSFSWPDSTTKIDQVTGLGNAVCPPVAARLVERVIASF